MPEFIVSDCAKCGFKTIVSDIFQNSNQDKLSLVQSPWMSWIASEWQGDSTRDSIRKRQTRISSNFATEFLTKFPPLTILQRWSTIKQSFYINFTLIEIVLFVNLSFIKALTRSQYGQFCQFFKKASWKLLNLLKTMFKKKLNKMS